MPNKEVNCGWMLASHRKPKGSLSIVECWTYSDSDSDATFGNVCFILFPHQHARIAFQHNDAPNPRTEIRSLLI